MSVVTDVKITLIDKIAEYHPGFKAGLKRQWSYYVGGMKDDGDWYKWKMLKEATIGQLEDCLTELRKESTPIAISDDIARSHMEYMNELYTNMENKLLWGKK